MTPKDYSKSHDTKKPTKRQFCDAIKPNREKCKLPAGYGTDHQGSGPCKHHFGNTARVVRGAAIEEGKEIVQVLRGMGVSVDMDPGEALRWEVNNTVGHIAWHRAVIEKWDLLKKDGTARVMTADQAEFYERYLAERQHLVRAARMAIAADVEGRAMRLAEQQAEMVGGALDRIFAALRLTAEQREQLSDIVPAEMRAISAYSPIVVDAEFYSTDDAVNAAYRAARKDEK